MTKHVLVLIHGITTDAQPNVTEQYGAFVQAVRERRLPLHGEICQVSWGGPGLDGKVTRPDQYLTKAECCVAKLLAQTPQMDQVADEGIDWGVPGFRAALKYARQSVVQFGLSDALYYSAPEGEKAV